MAKHLQTCPIWDDIDLTSLREKPLQSLRSTIRFTVAGRSSVIDEFKVGVEVVASFFSPQDRGLIHTVNTALLYRRVVPIVYIAKWKRSFCVARNKLFLTAPSEVLRISPIVRTFSP